ncbi:MAG: putative O-succinylbenzoate--CoA ligase (menE), partial [Frankiales bacterium]|nr:putative O-succinylbenzoate--CoA ligase (menE) [Frankiales bacterium]
NVELAARTRRLAAGLTQWGVRPGDRVAVVLPNRPELLQLYGALWRAGAAATPALPALTPEEVRHVLRNSEAVLLITEDERLHGLGVPTMDLAQLRELESVDEADAAPRSPEDLAALLYTGGTTGRAKGVMLSQGGLLAITKARESVTATAGAHTSVVPLPLSHVYGLVTTASRMHMSEPGLLVLQRRFQAEGWISLVEQHRAQASSMVPSMVQQLLLQPLEDHDLSSLTYVTTGGAPLPLPVWHELERRLPHVRLCDGYGCTEATSTVSMNPPDARRHGSVGKPVPGVSVAIAEDGEVLVRSPGVMLGYHRDPVATAETLDGGWLHTGDVGRLDSDGYLWITDRLKDVILRGGFNVYPRDVEDALLAHPAVARAAVVGRPDPVLGEEVVAFVSLRAPVTAAELLAFGRETIAAHKAPREVHVVDEVPLTSVGKTDRKAARALLAAHPPAVS